VKNQIIFEKKKIENFKDELNKLKYIKDKELLKCLIKPNLLYGNLGHIHYRMSAQINKILLDHYGKRMIFQSTRKLREAYKEILTVEEFINIRKPNPNDRTEEGRYSVFVNRNYYLDSLNHYITIIQNIMNNRLSYFAILFSIMAIVISIFYPN